MTVPAGRDRRAIMKLGLASAGIPLLSRALLLPAEAQTRREDQPLRDGSVVTVSPGFQMFYREDWLGAPWLDGEPVVFLHGNLETGEVWYGWVPRMAQQFRLFRPDLPGYGRSTV